MGLRHPVPENVDERQALFQRRERERGGGGEREKEREGEREKGRETQRGTEREREGKKERESTRERDRKRGRQREAQQRMPESAKFNSPAQFFGTLWYTHSQKKKRKETSECRRAPSSLSTAMTWDAMVDASTALERGAPLAVAARGRPMSLRCSSARIFATSASSTLSCFSFFFWRSSVSVLGICV